MPKKRAQKAVADRRIRTPYSSGDDEWMGTLEGGAFETRQTKRIQHSPKRGADCINEWKIFVADDPAETL
jgi:hypothetical protein